MSSRPKHYVPEPKVGLVFQMEDGERWVVTYNRKAIIGATLVRTDETTWISRQSWNYGFSNEQWLTV